MKRDRFQIDGLMCELYWSPELNPIKLAIYQYGFPGSVGINKLVSFLAENGFYVIVPHFPGTYDSDGFFSPKSAFEFYEKINIGVSDGFVIGLKKNKRISIPSKIEYAFGHSFGCWAILRGLKFLMDVKNLFLFGPAINYAELQYSTNCGFVEDGNEHLNMVMRTRPHTFRIENVFEFNKLYLGDLDEVEKMDNAVRRVIGVVGKEDNYFILDKLSGSFRSIILDSFVQKPNVRLIEVESGDHSLDSLLTDEVLTAILAG